MLRSAAFLLAFYPVSALCQLDAIDDALQILQDSSKNVGTEYQVQLGQSSNPFWTEFKGTSEYSEVLREFSEGAPPDWSSIISGTDNQDRGELGLWLSYQEHLKGQPISKILDPTSDSYYPNIAAAEVQPVSLSIGPEDNTARVKELSESIYMEGAIFDEDFIQRTLPQSQLDELSLSRNPTINLEDLGLTQPTGPVDVYTTFDADNRVTGIIVKRPDTGLSEEQQRKIDQAAVVKSSQPKWQEKVYSTIDYIVTQTVLEICKSPFKPSEFSIDVSGSGNAYFAELGIKVNAKFLSSEVCPAFSAN